MKKLILLLMISTSHFSFAFDIRNAKIGSTIGVL